jgi:hypothetical protein
MPAADLNIRKALFLTQDSADIFLSAAAVARTQGDFEAEMDYAAIAFTNIQHDDFHSGYYQAAYNFDDLWDNLSPYLKYPLDQSGYEELQRLADFWDQEGQIDQSSQLDDWLKAAVLP